MFEEKRRRFRIRVRGAMRVEVAWESETVRFDVLDMSDEGMRLSGQTRAPLKGKVRCRAVWDDKPNAENSWIEAEIIWKRKDQFGLRFLDGATDLDI